jgi:hypothetical protein
VVGIDISSAPATSIVLGPNNGWQNVCLQNLDLTNALYCGDSVSVSSITTNALIGTIIPPAVDATHPAQPTCFALVAGADFFCRTGSTSGTTRAGVAKSR